MAKTIQRRLRDATDLIAIAKLNSDAISSVCVYGGWKTTIHVNPLALVHLFKFFQVPLAKLRIERGKEGDLHIDFEARGVQWSCCVLAHREAEFREAIGAASRSAIDHRPTAKRMRAPEQALLTFKG